MEIRATCPKCGNSDATVDEYSGNGWCEQCGAAWGLDYE